MKKKIFMSLSIFCLTIHAQHMITVFQGLANQKQFTIDTDTLQTSNYSFHILIPTIGRKSIFRMLESLRLQLMPQDFLTIIFDAQDIHNVLQDVKQHLQSFSCTTQIIFEEKNLGYWGHAIRNKHSCLQGDFILHADDDDIYLPGAISIIRKICITKGNLYIFRIKYHQRTWWKKPKIYLRNIATPSGIISSEHNSLGYWGLFRGGDAAFYKDLSKKINPQKIFFVDFITYQA